MSDASTPLLTAQEAAARYIGEQRFDLRELSGVEQAARKSIIRFSHDAFIAGWQARDQARLTVSDEVQVVVVNGHDVYGIFNSYGHAEKWAEDNLGTSDFFTAPVSILDEWAKERGVLQPKPVTEEEKV